MEKEGLIRSVGLLGDAGLAIESFVTDRHPQIKKYVREEMKDTTHYFDVWHVAKGNLVLTEFLSVTGICGFNQL